MTEEPTTDPFVETTSSPLIVPVTSEAGETDIHPSRTRPAWVFLLVAALIGGAIGGGIVAIASRDTAGTDSVTAIPGSNLKLRGGALDIQGVLAKAEPAVVSIETDGFVRQNGFFGPTVQRVTGAGTGMVISADGEILTNNHVIEGAQRISVTFAGKSQPLQADLVGADPSSDVAVIKVRNASGLKTVSFGRSSTLKVGDDVVAIGNALALVGGNTVTRGIVSALERSVDEVGENLQHLIQTDAAINSGNSGGPLVDARGDVIGMNTIVIRGTNTGAAVESIGFAIAIDPIRPLIERLRKGQAAPGQAFIGVSAVDLNEDTKGDLGVPVEEGALIQDVAAGSPSDNAGLRVGDVVTEFDGRRIRGASGLVSAVRAATPGEKVSFVAYRGNDRREGTLTVGSRVASS